jgi:hypothetical protein
MTQEVLKLALEALTIIRGQLKSWGLGDEAITAIKEALAQPQQELVAWKNAAIRLGEELSSVGPDGYYEMTAEHWLDWAMEQKPQDKNSLAQPPVAKPHEQEQQAQQEPDYAWPTVADYEKYVGIEVNQVFKRAWNMARTTNDIFTQRENT